MKLNIEELRRHYASLSDEALREIDRTELVEIARQCYDQELALREPLKKKADLAKPAVRATGRFHDLWWDSQPMETPLRTRVGRAKGPAPQCSIAATKAGPTGASAADQGVRPTNRRRQRRNWWVVVQIIAGCEDFQAHAGSLTVAAR